jgi:hypothetical protein
MREYLGGETMGQFAVWLAGVGSPAPIVRPQIEVMEKERGTQPVSPEVFLEPLNLPFASERV